MSTDTKKPQKNKKKQDKPTNVPPQIEPNKPKEKEIGGRGGPDPTRFGDWEIGGKCVDF